MRALVVGAGAVGSLVGAKLALAGHRVTLVARQPHVNAIRADGLYLAEGGKRSLVRDIEAVTTVAEVWAGDASFDLILFTMKSYDVADAVAQVRSVTSHPPPILTLQNGVGNEEAVAATFGPATVIAGIITTPVTVPAPGAVKVTTRGRLGLAPLAVHASVAELAGAFRAAGFRTSIYADYRAMKWSKLLLNIIGNATSAILDLPPSQVFADRRLFNLEFKAWHEALSVMRALGLSPVTLPGYPVPWLVRLLDLVPHSLLQPLAGPLISGGRGGKMPSMHIDLNRGKHRSEVEVLNGAVVKYARRVRMAVPFNEALYSILAGIVKGTTPWERFRGQPDRLLEVVAQAQERRQKK